jgi:opacity protein-like surface antigen
MKRTILILLAILTLMPAALRAQDVETVYRPLGVGFQVGVGGMVPTGSLADEFKGCALFTGGINFDYNQLRLKIDLAYGQPSFKNDNPYAIYDGQGRDIQLNATANPTLFGVAMQLGYTVWRQGRVSITPAVGFTASRLSWDLNQIKYEKDDEGQERPTIDNVTGAHENSLGWMASVDIDIKLHGKLVDYPISDNGQAHYTSSVRISPFVTHAKYSHFDPSVKGCCVGVTLSYAGLLRALSSIN